MIKVTNYFVHFLQVSQKRGSFSTFIIIIVLGDVSSESVVGLLYALLSTYHNLEELIRQGCVPAFTTMMLQCPRNDKVEGHLC